MNELKPCPFCGGEARLRAFRTYIQSKHRMGEKYYIECCECGLNAPNFINKEEAIEAWNRRVDDER